MIRDEKSTALINTDTISLNKYKQERDKARKLELLTREVSEIKKILDAVCEKLEKIERA